MDITRDVSALLATKPDLLARLREVERVIGRAVVFDRNDALPAGAGGKATPDGTVTLARDSAANLSVIGEEIMHLERWTSGYPVIQPAPIATQHGYALGLTQLAGHFDEFAFFPFLEQLQLSPRNELTPKMVPAVRALEVLRPQIEQDGDTAAWRVLIAVTFVQTELLAAESAHRDLLLNALQQPFLAPFQPIGALLRNEVVAARDETPDQVEVRMERCLHQHLNLAPATAVVARIF